MEYFTKLETVTKYSICATIYNSASLIDEAVGPLVSLNSEFEIVIVDNNSTDGTIEKLKKYGDRIKFTSLKCSRGFGRQRAMELSSGDVIIHLTDLDVAYENIDELVKIFEGSYAEKIVNFSPKTRYCNAGMYIGKRKFFELLGGFPDLNNSDDAYFNKIAESFDLLEFASVDIKHKCLEIKGKNSGQESRYEKKIFKKLIRRIYSTRDILFVQEFAFYELMQWYHLRKARIVIYGIPLYILGRILILKIRVPNAEKKIKELHQTQ